MNHQEFKKLLNKNHLVNVATVNADGHPNAAPKLILKTFDEFIYLVDCTVGKTWENLKRDARVSLSFADHELLKGYQIKGFAKIIEGAHICQQLIDDLEEKEIALTVTRLIDGVHDGKKHHDFEIGMSNKFVVFKIKILEVIEIGYKGNITRQAFRDLLESESQEVFMDINVRKPNDSELQELGIITWPIWEKKESIFDWHYDQKEICYLLDGDVNVTLSDGRQVSFQAGDLVTFPKGLSCRWHIKKAVRKHYCFF